MNTFKISIAAAALLFLMPTAYSQDETYILNPANTQEILKSLQKYPQVNQVAKKRFAIATTRKRKTAAYVFLEKQIKQLRADSIAIAAEYHDQIDGYNGINQIKVLIEKFYSSTLAFSLKKKHLIKAQEIATRQNKNFLIYADNTINPSQNSKFVVLKSNLTDLKVHHRRIIRAIEKNNPKPELASAPPEINEDLVLARAKIKKVKKYEIVPSKSKKYTSKKLVVGNAVNNLSSLSGTFRKSGNYYVMAKDYGTVFNKQLLKKEALKTLRIPQNKIISTQPQCVFTNIETEVQYIASPDFLEQFNVVERIGKERFLTNSKSVSQKGKTAKIKSVVSYKATKIYVKDNDQEVKR